jgi:hypothetical protein
MTQCPGRPKLAMLASPPKCHVYPDLLKSATRMEIVTARTASLWIASTELAYQRQAKPLLERHGHPVNACFGAFILGCN